MRLILKYTLRNILIKPLRTAVIVLCLTAVSLTLSLCLTANTASEKVIEEQIRRSTGRADIIMSSAEGMDALPEMSGDMEALPVIQTSSYLQLHSIENYKYVQKKNITVLGIDTAAGTRFNMLPECAQPGDGEVLISYGIARLFGYETGDRLTLPCADSSQLTLTVGGTVGNSGYLSARPLTVIVSPDAAKKIAAAPGIAANVLYIDVSDDSAITEASELLADEYPELELQQIMGTAESNEIVSGITSSFFTIFAVTFLMIVFIISAFSKGIAAERLSVIGTLRSIGAEKKTASMTLLLECAVYGVFGGILSLVPFYALKDALIGSMLPVTEESGINSVHAPAYIPLSGIVLAAAVSCIFSLGSVLRTSKIPLRDIIFGGKESVYRPSRAAAVCGAVMTAVSVLLYLGANGFTASLIALAAFVTGICLVIPTLLSLLSKTAARTANGTKFPVLRLALIQSGTKKASVTGTVICTAAMILAAALYVLSGSVEKLCSVRNYDCGIIITELSERADRYSVITSEKSEFIYNTEEFAEINGIPVNADIFGYDGFEMFSGISGLPEKLGSSEISLDSRLMKRLGIQEGDTVLLTVKRNTVRPVTLELMAVPGCNSIYYDMRCNVAAISLDTYISVYRDHPSMLLLDTADSSLALRQLTDSSARAEMSEEYYLRSEEEARSLTALLYEIAALGMILAVISTCGSQTTGFEQRRHELAVLSSHGMSRAQLSKMLVTESAVTAAVPAVTALIFGRVVIAMIGKILSTLDMNISVSFEPVGIAAFIGLMAAAVLLTALIPIRTLKKMNAAETLKQE